MKRILISGGAGFIGSSLALRLLEKGVKVRVLDNLSPQIHGEDAENSFLFSRVRKDVELVRGDVRDESAWKTALVDCDAVVHLAAETGTGQSMYQIRHYAEVNALGTANLMQILADSRSEIERLVIASSRAVYGEGRYHCRTHGDVYPKGRLEADMGNGCFEPRCPDCGEFAEVRPTGEDSLLRPTSLYGVTKLTQEQLIMTMGAALDIPCVGLRFQNVFGPGQSLHNPYTGILAIFTSLLRKGKAINIFEDGRESRDFVYIDDVVQSVMSALQGGPADGEVLNIGTGVPLTVIETATYLKELVGGDSRIEITGNFRLGDIRHNIADITKAERLLGFKPAVSVRDGIRKYVEWVMTQEATTTAYESSLEEMRRKGLFK